MGLDDGPGNSQTQARTFGYRAVPIKLFEDPLLVAGLDSYALIGDLDLDKARFAKVRANLDGRIGRGVPKCVFEQVNKRLFKEDGVNLDEREVVWDVYG